MDAVLLFKKKKQPKKIRTHDAPYGWEGIYKKKSVERETRFELATLSLEG